MADRLACVPRVQEVWSLNPGPAKSCTALQTVRHRFNIYAGSCVALTLCHGDRNRKLVTRFGVMGECKERFGNVNQYYYDLHESNKFYKHYMIIRLMFVVLINLRKCCGQIVLQALQIYLNILICSRHWS